MFSVEDFLATTITDAGSTQATAVPTGEYVAIATKMSLRNVDTKDGARVILELSWDIQDQDGRVKTVTGRDKNFARQSLWLDLTDDGKLDMSKGQNIGLNRVREALGQNKAGVAWRPDQLLNCPAQVSVEDQVVGDKTYANVNKVSAL